jgi:ribonucleotide reductase beta subunit family protein with ferritin-like domain
MEEGSKGREEEGREGRREGREGEALLLAPNPNVYVLIEDEANPTIWDFYKRHEACFWTREEIKLGDDLAHWQSLTDGERHFISHVLAFFAASDGIVNENLATQFMREVQLPEARAFYSVQIMMETIHSEMYASLIAAYVPDRAQRTRLFQAVREIPCVALKAQWAMRWMAHGENGGVPFRERLVAFAIVEGVFFSSSFCAIYWLRKRNLMPGLCQSNEFIARDEGLHCDFACYLYNAYCDRIPRERLVAMMTEATACELSYVNDSLQQELLGINATSMGQYVRFCADRLMVALGEEKIFGATNPFDWMEFISLQGKTNFFERGVSEYAKAGVKVAANKASLKASVEGARVFSLIEEF